MLLAAGHLRPILGATCLALLGHFSSFVASASCWQKKCQGPAALWVFRARKGRVLHNFRPHRAGLGGGRKRSYPFALEERNMQDDPTTDLTGSISIDNYGQIKWW